VSQSITFFSTCPTCGHQQPQDGYSRAGLTKRLERGRIIEAYCLNCDVRWPISPDERAAMAEAMVAGHQDASSLAGDCAPKRATEGQLE
jgi:hypothetical protein